MLDFIMVPAMFAIIGTFTYRIFELYARRKERLNLIEKMSELKNIDSDIKVNIDFFSKGSRGIFTALRFALLLCGLGLGLLIGFYLMIYVPMDLDNMGYRYHETVLAASVLLFGGLGLVISFLLELYLARKDK